jgi:hypothetical protein
MPEAKRPLDCENGDVKPIGSAHAEPADPLDDWPEALLHAA